MIDWKTRISKDDKGIEYIDMQGMPYYYLKYDETCKTEIIHDTNVLLPVEPRDEDVVNYGLPIDEQIFRKTFIPEQARNPKKDFGRENWTEKEMDDFVDSEFNRKHNGVWFFIKGKKYYITGQHWLKMNHWHNNTDEEFEYRDHERKLFTFLLQVQRDPIDLGVDIFKCRQLGDTENTLVVLWERGSRIRGGLATMQSFTGEDHVKETYDRLVHGHNNMIHYFKPMSDGTEKAASGLKMRYPAKHNTHAEIKKQHQANNIVNQGSIEEYQHPPLNSRFRFGTSKAIKFDGATGILTVYGDEFGKASDSNPNEWLRTMVEAVFSNIRGKKRGFILMTSTAEEVTENSLEYAKVLYKESDPNKRLRTGSTLNRIVRIFRGVGCRGFETIVADKWGFIDEEAVIAAVTEKFNAMISAGNMLGAMSFIRKNPRTIDDVFKSANKSQFNIQNLENRLTQIDLMTKKPYVRGNFKWRDGVRDSEVIWEPNQQGRWSVSRHPHDYGLESNVTRVNIISKKPANSHYFSAGVDPIDQKNTVSAEGELSKASFCIGRRFDKNLDGGEDKYYQFDDEIRGIQKGDPIDVGAYHQSNKAICTYLNRPNDPFDFFEDLLMTLVYYGSDYLPEKNKAGALLTYMSMRGYDGYLMDKPTSQKNVKGKTEKDGVTMTEKSATDIFNYITTYTCKMANALDHPELISQLLSMNWDNRGKKDLGVSFGWMLYAFNNKKSKALVDKEEEVTGVVHWEENVV